MKFSCCTSFLLAPLLLTGNVIPTTNGALLGSFTKDVFWFDSCQDDKIWTHSINVTSYTSDKPGEFCEDVAHSEFQFKSNYETWTCNLPGMPAGLLGQTHSCLSAGCTDCTKDEATYFFIPWTDSLINASDASVCMSFLVWQQFNESAKVVPSMIPPTAVVNSIGYEGSDETIRSYFEVGYQNGCQGDGPPSDWVSITEFNFSAWEPFTGMAMAFTSQQEEAASAVEAEEEGAPTDEAIKDDLPEDEAIKDDLPEDEAIKDDLPEDEAIKDDLPEDEAIKDDLPDEEEAIKDALPEEEANESGGVLLYPAMVVTSYAILAVAVGMVIL